MEEWKEVEGYEGLYQVSNLGNVRSLDRFVTQKTKWGYNITRRYKGKILKKSIDKDGYRVVSLANKGEKQRCVSRLVGIAFVPIPERLKGIPIEELQVDHIIPIKNGGTDEASNLRWCTPKENSNNKITLNNHSKGMKGKLKGEKHPFYGKKMPEHSKRLSKPIVEICSDGTIKEWVSTLECHKATKYSLAHLTNAVNGKNRKLGHHFKGSEWYFKEDYEKKVLGSET